MNLKVTLNVFTWTINIKQTRNKLNLLNLYTDSYQLEWWSRNDQSATSNCGIKAIYVNWEKWRRVFNGNLVNLNIGHILHTPDCFIVHWLICEGTCEIFELLTNLTKCVSLSLYLLIWVLQNLSMIDHWQCKYTKFVYTWPCQHVFKSREIHVYTVKGPKAEDHVINVQIPKHSKYFRQKTKV